MPRRKAAIVLATLILVITGGAAYLVYKGAGNDLKGWAPQTLSVIPWGSEEGNVGLGKKKGGAVLGPTSISMDPRGVIYVPDPVNGRVLTVNTRNPKDAKCAFKSEKAVIKPVSAVAGPAGDLYLIDGVSGRLFRDKPGTVDGFLSEPLLPEGFGTGDVYRVEGVAADEDGNLYLLDTLWMTMYTKHRVVAMPAQGEPRIVFAQTMERSGEVQEEPARPNAKMMGPMQGFAVSPGGRVFLHFGSAESGSHTIAMVDERGRVLSTTEVGKDEGSSGDERTNGTEPEEIKLVAADRNDHFYIGRDLQGSSPLLEKFSPSGKLVSTVFLTGSWASDRLPGMPVSVAVQPGGTIYALVPEKDGARIVKFDTKFRLFSSAQ